MSGISGLSALLTISLVALVTMQVLKGQMDTFENYGDNVPYTYIDNVPGNNYPSEKRVKIPVLPNLQAEPKHGLNDFGVGETFRNPYINTQRNSQWSNQPNQLLIDQAQVAAMTPTEEQLRLVGAGTLNLPGPFQSTEAMGATQQQNNLSLCSQNFGIYGNGLSSSLLPAQEVRNEGFQESFTSGRDNSCKMSSLIGNQTMLSPPQQIGFNPTMGATRNANLQLRSEPPNPVVIVSPWMNSTIGPDLLRRPLEDNSSNFGLYGNGPNSGANPTSIQNGPNNLTQRPY